MTTVTSAFSAGNVVVRKSTESGDLSYEEGGWCQSEADADGISLSPYIHVLLSLLHQKRCKRVLMIGCAGGTLATLLVRANVHVTAIDINPTAFLLARRHFRMSARVKCVVADGAEYLAACSEIYDGIVVDAYLGKTLPEHLRSLAFLRHVKRSLERSDGIFLTNVLVHHDFDLTTDRLAETAAGLWTDVCILDTRGQRDRNAIVLTGAIQNVDRPTLIFPPARQSADLEQSVRGFTLRKGRLTDGHSVNAHFRRLAATQERFTRQSRLPARRFIRNPELTIHSKETFPGGE